MESKSQQKRVEIQKKAEVREEVAPVEAAGATASLVTPTAHSRGLQQYELSDDDMAYLGKKAWSKEAWLHLAIRHGFEPGSQEKIADADDRAYLAKPKKWTAEERAKIFEEKKNKPLSTQGR